MQCLVCESQEQEELGNKDGYKLLQCNDCDLKFLGPIPSDEVLTEYYNSQENQTYYKQAAERKVKSGTRKIKRLIKYIKNGNFLDVGCNAGANTEAARQLGFNALGIDLSEGAIGNARELFPENRFELMTIEDLEQTGEKFDLIFCSEVIEHTTNPHSFVKSLKAIMNPGAVLYLTTPDAGHFRVPRDFVSWKHVHAPDHVCYFNRENLTKLLEKYGIEVIRFRWTTKTNLQAIAKNM